MPCNSICNIEFHNVINTFIIAFKSKDTKARGSIISEVTISNILGSLKNNTECRGECDVLDFYKTISIDGKDLFFQFCIVAKVEYS